MSGAILGLLAVMVAVVPPFILPASALPVTVGLNEVTNWSNFNYEGYQGQTSYPEFHSLMQTMSDLGQRYGCGRAMWEHSASENRFGTPEALMLLPFETNGCIDSMEGLLFESSATTPYHFLNQAELSAGPSEPEVGLPYGAVAYGSSPESSAWALLAVCVCGLGFAGYRRSRTNRLSSGIE